jgi:hypothetical protein
VDSYSTLIYTYIRIFRLYTGLYVRCTCTYIHIDVYRQHTRTHTCVCTVQCVPRTQINSCKKVLIHAKTCYSSKIMVTWWCWGWYAEGRPLPSP